MTTGIAVRAGNLTADGRRSIQFLMSYLRHRRTILFHVRASPERPSMIDQSRFVHFWIDRRRGW
jgi:hypothetical protein